MNQNRQLLPWEDDAHDILHLLAQLKAKRQGQLDEHTIATSGGLDMHAMTALEFLTELEKQIQDELG